MNCMPVINQTFGLTIKKDLVKDAAVGCHRYIFSSIQEIIPKKEMVSLGRKVTNHYHHLKYMLNHKSILLHISGSDRAIGIKPICPHRNKSLKSCGLVWKIIVIYHKVKNARHAR